MKTITRTLSVFAMLLALAGGMVFAADKNVMHTSGVFAGAKANTGTVSHTYENGKSILRVSQDFRVPDTPAPTWRVVDSNGTI
jgi:hypothetical protein